MIPQFSITHIFFDVGGTLMHPQLERVVDVCARNGISVSLSELTRAEERAHEELDHEKLITTTNDSQRFDLYYASMLRHAGIKGDSVIADIVSDLRATHQENNLWGRVHPEVYEGLATLRDAEFKLGIISNANGTVRDKLDKVGLLPFFDCVIDSHYEGVEKPNPEIFRRAMAKMNTTPKQSVYVGDLYHIDGVGSIAAGMQFAFLTRTLAGQLRARELCVYSCASVTELAGILKFANR